MPLLALLTLLWQMVLTLWQPTEVPPHQRGMRPSDSSYPSEGEIDLKMWRPDCGQVRRTALGPGCVKTTTL